MSFINFSVIALNAFGLMTPASESVIAVSFEVAQHFLRRLRICFLLISGIGAKMA